MATAHKRNNKEVIPSSKVKKKRKKKVSKGHPLANLPVEYLDVDEIEVIDDEEWEEESLEPGSGSELDLEYITSEEFMPGPESDSVPVDTFNTLSSNATLETPENVSFSTSNISYRDVGDGSLRASLYISFDEVYRASDYEVRITE